MLPECLVSLTQFFLEWHKHSDYDLNSIPHLRKNWGRESMDIWRVENIDTIITRILSSPFSGLISIISSIEFTHHLIGNEIRWSADGLDLHLNGRVEIILVEKISVSISLLCSQI